MVVGLAIIAALAAFVYPVVVQQIDKWQALRVARDLSNLRLALEQFHLDTRNHPLYLSQLGNAVTEIDQTLSSQYAGGAPFSAKEVKNWNGPYIDLPLLRTLEVDSAVFSGFDSNIVNDLYCVDGVVFPATCGRGTWVALLAVNLRGHQFDQVNQLLDPGEKDLPPEIGRTRGRLIFFGPPGIEGDLYVAETIYLATPYLLDE